MCMGVLGGGVGIVDGSVIKWEGGEEGVDHDAVLDAFHGCSLSCASHCGTCFFGDAVCWKSLA